MSAPDTNTQKQAVQHRGPLRGMALVVAFALILLVALVFFVSSRGGAPEGADTQIDGRSGETTETPIGSGESGPSANDIAADDAEASTEEGGAAAPAEADPAAVTVPGETAPTPDTGAGPTADTDPGESESAQPLDASPGDGEVDPAAN